MKSVACRIALLLVALSIAPAIPRAQDWPSKPVIVAANIKLQ